MKTTKKSKAKRTRRKVHTEEYRSGNVTWKLRLIVPAEGDRHKTPFWQGDNCNRNDRKRIAAATKSDVLTLIDEFTEERKKHGTAHQLDHDLREAALKAVRVSAGRATLDQIVKFWEERHPKNGNTIGLGEMVSDFLAERRKIGNRPETIRELRRKLTKFEEANGKTTPIASIWEAEVKRFMANADGGAASVRAWKKVLGSFFKWCIAQGAITNNPAAAILVPQTIRKPPETWTAGDVESFMRVAEGQAPDMVAGFAILWWAGLRPTELVGQYGLEHTGLKAARKKLQQARTNYEAEKMRLGLVRERGADTAKQAANRIILEESPAAKKFKNARDRLAKLQKQSGGAMPGLQWKDICLDDPVEKFISIRPETSKVQEARHVEILPNLEIWLRKYRKVGGPVVANPTAFRRARERIMEKMTGARWTADVCRHSFASYHYKANGNRDKLAEMLGHTDRSREIEKHYKNATVSRADAEKYWQIVPDSEAASAQAAHKAQDKKRTARKGA